MVGPSRCHRIGKKFFSSDTQRTAKPSNQCLSRTVRISTEWLNILVTVQIHPGYQRSCVNLADSLLRIGDLELL